MIESKWKLLQVDLLKSEFHQKIFFTGKCIITIGEVVASIYTGGNPLVVYGTMSSICSIVKDI